MLTDSDNEEVEYEYQDFRRARKFGDADASARKETGKRKLKEKVSMSTIDKLASLDLDSDDEEVNFPPQNQVFAKRLVSFGRGRGRLPNQVGNFKLPMNNFRVQLRNDMPTRVVQPPKQDVSMFFDTDEEIEFPKPRASKVIEEHKQQIKETELPLIPSTPADMCQMKYLRTIAMGNDGKLRCTVLTSPESVTGSETGKTESIIGDTIKDLTYIYEKKRATVIDSNGIVATPLHVVKQLALLHGETLHCEISASPTFQCVELFSGTLRGMGEGVTKRIAAQMAAIDILERIRLSGGTVKVPQYALVPGMLTSNRIFHDLMAVCKSKGLPPIKITCTINGDDNGKVDVMKAPPYRAQCWVGEDLVTEATSEAEVFARREAAKMMYQVLTDAEYKDSPYAIGQGCQALTGGTIKRPVMSAYKKSWLLQNRVKNGVLEILPEESGFDGECDVRSLMRDVANMADKAPNTSYKLMKKSISVTVSNQNKKKRVAFHDEANEVSPDGNSKIVRLAPIDSESDDSDNEW